jgi:two-component system chemotaxis sensor kinase CheA
MRTAYREEASELLQQLETTLLALETSPQDMELIGAVFRQMHTIKGSGAMFGFDRIAAFTHHVETAFGLVRAGKVPVTQPLITLTLEARDHIKAMLDADFGGAPADDAHGEVILARFRELIGDKGKETAPQQRPT